MGRTSEYNRIREQRVGRANGSIVGIEEKRMQLLDFWLA